MQLPSVTSTLDIYIAQINRYAILSADEEFRFAVKFKKYNDMEAAEKLVVSNLRFVVKIAHEYRNYGVKLADLIQEGNIGLMHAVKKFDPYKGYRLISYAVWWIRAYIQNFIIKSWSLVKIGTTQAQRKLFFKLGQAKRKLEPAHPRTSGRRVATRTSSRRSPTRCTRSTTTTSSGWAELRAEAFELGAANAALQHVRSTIRACSSPAGRSSADSSRSRSR